MHGDGGQARDTGHAGQGGQAETNMAPRQDEQQQNGIRVQQEGEMRILLILFVFKVY